MNAEDPGVTTIGVLALQGDFFAHEACLARHGVATVRIRKPEQLTGIDGIVLPGGESSTMLRLLDYAQLFEPLRDRIASGLPTLGTCAGLILLANEVEDPRQPSLGLLDVTVSRNAYGAQVHSGLFDIQGCDGLPPSRGIFIRAPRITRIGNGVEVLATRDGDAVLVRQDAILGAAFHPELDAAGHITHELFLKAVSRRSALEHST